MENRTRKVLVFTSLLYTVWSFVYDSLYTFLIPPIGWWLLIPVAYFGLLIGAWIAFSKKRYALAIGLVTLPVLFLLMTAVQRGGFNLIPIAYIGMLIGAWAAYAKKRYYILAMWLAIVPTVLVIIGPWLMFAVFVIGAPGF